MNRLAAFLVGRRWALIIFPLVLATALAIAVPDETGSGSAVVLALLAFFALLAAAVLVLNLAGYDPDADDTAATMVGSFTAQALVARWLRRSRYYRFVGGSVGFVLGFGFIDNGDLLAVLVGLLAGVAGGGALAEIHAIGRSRSSARSAELSSRRVGDYVPRIDALAMAAVAGASVVVGLAALFVSTANVQHSHRWAAAALAITAAIASLQRMVALRPRPALPQDLRSADDLLRHLAASRGFARPGLALAFLCLAESVRALGPGGNFGAVAPLLWLVALGWYLASRQNRDALANRALA